MTVPTRRATVLMAVCAAVALGLGVLTRPAPTTLPSTRTGDAALAALGREVVGPDRPALAVAAVTPDRTRTAVLGAAPDARFEIGSITKGVTGLLFADMIARGEVAPTTTVGALLPVEGPLAGVTVEQLATHRSGLPSVPGGVGPSLRGWWSALSAGNPYPYSTAQIVDAAADARLDAPPGTYSNLGFAVLGAALAAAADRPHAELVTERVLTPLGMTGAAVVTTPDALGPRDLTGETPGGRRADPWAGEGIAPAGSVRADIADTARLARALLVGDAPGIDALLPRADLAPDRIGWGWLSRPDRVSGHTVVWHNGGTGGFTSFLGVDRHAGVAVVVLSAVGESPDTTTLAGFALLRRLSGAR
jgi:CubicO group peptidase (beta-lactamase class C family)